MYARHTIDISSATHLCWVKGIVACMHVDETSFKHLSLPAALMLGYHACMFLRMNLTLCKIGKPVWNFNIYLIE